MKLAGNDMLIQSLVDEGVEFLFGYPGGAALHIYDAIFNQNKLQHILVRHEQGATHAADGYARATGKPGVVLVTSGPGATNAITGIATAFMDSIPMVGPFWSSCFASYWYRCISRNRYDWHIKTNC
jgi:acetolactate synthase-1/2/3 large subunit